MAKEIYVVVADNDKGFQMVGTEELFHDEKGPLVFETYINDASRKNAKKFINILGGKYGKCRIAKLEFIK